MGWLNSLTSGYALNSDTAMNPPVRRIQIFEPYDAIVTHGIFTRHGGISSGVFASLNVSFMVGDSHDRVTENRRRCVAALELEGTPLTVAGLVHGAAVAAVESAPVTPMVDGSLLVAAVDALTSATPGRPLLITAADCLQVILLDPATPAVGLVHAGWRGLVAGSIGATIAAMHAGYGSDPSRMLAGIGPGLGPCCAEFTDPSRDLPDTFAPYIRGRRVDLWAAARCQLRDAGLDEARIELCGICTRCRKDEFFSHRGDYQHTGRFAAIVSLR
jgi:YfiH family protein